MSGTPLTELSSMFILFSGLLTTGQTTVTSQINLS